MNRGSQRLSASSSLRRAPASDMQHLPQRRFRDYGEFSDWIGVLQGLCGLSMSRSCCTVFALRMSAAYTQERMVAIVRTVCCACLQIAPARSDSFFCNALFSILFPVYTLSYIATLTTCSKDVKPTSVWLREVDDPTKHFR